MPIWLIQILVGIAFSVAGQIATSMAQRDAGKQVAGVRGTLQWGGDLSPRFVVGRYGTAGQLRYAGTWGNAGDTPNAYFSRVVEISCLPVRGYAGWYVNGERVTLAEARTGDLGYAVLEYRRKGVDYLWINPYTGDQTDEDPLMLAQFGADPDRPYAGMIGRGCGYFVATARYHRELFAGRLPEVLAEVEGIALDDPRGDGQHDNPIVAAYTLLKGLSYGGEWLYGPQGITDVHFRADNLATEADKCDAARPLAGGGSEKRFRIGLDIALDEEPHAVVGELLKACSGRWADLGGIYRFLVGAPAEPVVAFTDEDVVISEPQELDPFPGLESLTNAMTATYPAPEEAWVMRDAPAYYSVTLESEDDGRRLPFSTEFRAVPHAIQVQELMRTAVEDARRFRRHTQTMPPEWWEYEPLDSVAWTSARNGYAAKAQLITMIEDLPNANQFVALQEIEPGDYAWSSAYQLPVDVAELVTARPAPQPITGFAVAPYIGRDAAGNARRPGFVVSGYGAGLVDVRAVWVQARLPDSTGLIIDGEAPYDPEAAEPSAAWAGDPLFRDEDYQVRGKLVPYSGRETEWSAWLAVRTPDVRLTDQDVDLSEVAADVVQQLDWVKGGLRQALEGFRRLGTILEEESLANYNLREQLRREVSVQMGELQAGFSEVIEVALGPGGSIATALSSLYAAMGGNTAEVLVRWEAVATPAGVAARWALQLSVDGAAFASAGIYLEVTDLGVSRIVLDASQTVMTTDGGANVSALFDANGALIRDLRVGTIEGPGGTSFWDLSTGAFRVST